MHRYGKRALDPDNGTAGLKPILDSLTQLNLIVDDSDKWITLRFENMKLLPGEKPHTKIILEDLDG